MHNESSSIQSNVNPQHESLLADTAENEASENKALWQKNIGEAKWLLLALVLLLFSFCWVRTWIVSLLEADRFAAVIQPLWDKWSQFSPVSLKHLLSYPGRVAMTYVEPIVTFGMAVWAISRGSDSVSGELGRGSLEMLLAQPVSRLQVLWTQATVTISGAAILAMACWCGNWVGVNVTTVTISEQPLITRIPGIGLEIPNPFLPAVQREVPMRELVNTIDLLPAVFNLFCLGFCLAGLATLASSYDRYRWRAIGVVSTVFVVQFIIKGFALSTESLLWLKRFTFFTAFEPQAFVELATDEKRSAETWSFWLSEPTQAFETLGPMGNNAILLGIGLAAYAIATVVFAKRDLPAPL
jgi:ABC-2 type transport system permease protein